MKLAEHLTTSEGFLDLGMVDEAWAETAKDLLFQPLGSLPAEGPGSGEVGGV
jgi:hypothetical protein